MITQEEHKIISNQNIKTDEQDYSLVVYNNDEQKKSLKTKEENAPAIQSKKDFQSIDKKEDKKELETDSEEYRRGYDSRDYYKKRDSYYDGKYDSYYNGNFDSDDERNDDSEEDEENELGNKDDFSNYDTNDHDISIGMPVYERIICKKPKDDGLEHLPGWFVAIMFMVLLLFPLFSSAINDILKILFGR